MVSGTAKEVSPGLHLYVGGFMEALGGTHEGNIKYDSNTFTFDSDESAEKALQEGKKHFGESRPELSMERR